MPSLEHDPDRTQRLPALDASGAETLVGAAWPGGAMGPGTEIDLTGRLRAAEALCAHYLDALELRDGRRGVTDEHLLELERELGATRRRAAAFEDDCRALTAALRAGAGPPAAAEDVGAAAPVGAREAEIDAERSARLAAERARRALESRMAEQLARIAELESLAESLGHALQARTEAASRAHAASETAEHTVRELRQLVARLEQQASGAAAAGEPPAADHARVEELTLQLAKTRGALEERELQIRRLERNLTRRSATPEGGPAAAPPPTHGAAALCPLNGSAPYPIGARTRTRIGRAPDNEICVEDASVSRHHAAILSTSTGTFIEDLRSVNGIGVNGRRVRLARLAEGDIVTLGTLRFRFALAPSAAAAG